MKRLLSWIAMGMLLLSIILFHRCSLHLPPRASASIQTAPLAEVQEDYALFNADTLLVYDCRLEGGFHVLNRGCYMLRSSSGKKTLLLSNHLLSNFRGKRVEVIVKVCVLWDVNGRPFVVLREGHTSLDAEQFSVKPE